MRILCVAFCVLLPSMSQADDWSPPKNPNVDTIRAEAQQDRKEGRYEVALQKHIWYHENALQLGKGQGGVRLSFVLSDWLELGEVYPPALEAMRQVRDETEKRIRDKDRVRVAFLDFHDFVALNRTLRQQKRTAETFQWLDETDPEDAQRVFGVAKPAIIKEKLYELYAKYIDVEGDLERIRRNYADGLKLAQERFGESHREYTEKKFLNSATTLVAVLVQVDRKAEAEQVAEAVRGFVSQEKLVEKLNSQLESALSGIVPKPWP
jgi:hypothetical protein